LLFASHLCIVLFGPLSAPVVAQTAKVQYFHAGASSGNLQCPIHGDNKMRYGFYLPTRGPTSDPDSLVAMVAEAERRRSTLR